MDISKILGRFKQQRQKLEIIPPSHYFLPNNDVLQNISPVDIQALYDQFFNIKSIGEMEDYARIANGDTWVIPFLNILLAYANSLGYQGGWNPNAGDIEFCMYYGKNANVSNVLNCAITADEQGYFFDFTSSIKQNEQTQSTISLSTIYYPTAIGVATIAMQQMGLIETGCVQEPVEKPTDN